MVVRVGLLSLCFLSATGCTEQVSPYVGTWEGETSRVVLQRNGLGTAKVFGAVTDRPLSWSNGVDGAMLSVGEEFKSARQFTATITDDGRLRVLSSGVEELLRRKQPPEGAPGP